MEPPGFDKVSVNLIEVFDGLALFENQGFRVFWEQGDGSFLVIVLAEEMGRTKVMFVLCRREMLIM